MAHNADKTDLHPDKPIRRFDVFAEYSRLDRLDKGYRADEAKGYGIWLAKVVASRKAGAKPSGKHHGGPEPKFRSIGDQLQTDETFDHDIIDRMGPAFYANVFSPAIAAAREQGETYEEIRDPIRAEWKPKKAAPTTS
jgi:hypothetical protein